MESAQEINAKDKPYFDLDDVSPFGFRWGS